jgi:hypothetical protein
MSEAIETEGKRYVGVVVTIVGEEPYGFIDKNTVTTLDGGPMHVVLTGDIFIHRHDCEDLVLRKGVEVSFELTPDTRRKGEGSFRAVKVQEVVSYDLVPTEGEVLPGLGLAIRCIAGRDPKHLAMKPVPAEAVELALRNRPLKGLPRDEPNSNTPVRTDESIRLVLATYLRNLFPGLQNLELDYDVVEFDETAQDAQIAEALATYQALEMRDQIENTTELYRALKATRRLLNWIYQQGWFGSGSRLTPNVIGGLVKLVEATMGSSQKDDIVNNLQGVLGFMGDHDLLRPNTVIPMRLFVELFVAAPVCYFALEGEELAKAQAEMRLSEDTRDPRPHPAVVDACKLFPGNARWSDAFQMFNRRCRPLQSFRGDVIPPAVARLIAQARRVFTRVIIMTPYLDVAGADWSDPAWLRSIDPFVVGIKEGCPVFFFLARFSDLGIFPLMEELVGDTLQFLKNNEAKLEGFNTVRSPYWYRPDRPDGSVPQLGTVLRERVAEMLTAYEATRLFDWLRKEWDIPTEAPLAQTETANK